MEIPALLYFSFWSLISMASLKLGFITLERENSTIAPFIVFLIKRSLAVFVCHSSTYALVHRFGANNASLLNHFKLSILGFPFLFYVCPLSLRFVLCYACAFVTVVSLLVPTLETGSCIDFVIRSIVFSLEVGNDASFPIFVLVAAFFTAGLAGISGGVDSSSNRDIKPVEVCSKNSKTLRFIATTVAGLVLQILVRFESLGHMSAFLWFLVAWLGCAALTIDRFDLGLFDLMVNHLLIGCTIRFGISFGPTWLAFGVSVLLFMLHPKVRSVRFVPDRDVVLW